MQSGSQAGGDPGVSGHSPPGGPTELCQCSSPGLHQHPQASRETAVQQDSKVGRLSIFINMYIFHEKTGLTPMTKSYFRKQVLTSDDLC